MIFCFSTYLQMLELSDFLILPIWVKWSIIVSIGIFLNTSETEYFRLSVDHLVFLLDELPVYTLCPFLCWFWSFSY